MRLVRFRFAQRMFGICVDEHINVVTVCVHTSENENVETDNSANTSNKKFEYKKKKTREKRNTFRSEGKHKTNH